MKITLLRFRSHQNSTFEFHNGKLNLLNGPTGTGKSQVFKAIQWALYGKVRKVYPIGTTGTATRPTAVTIEFPELGGLCIKRSAPPNRLEVGIDHKGEVKQMAADEGQNYINDLFGSEQLWLATAYSVQRERSPLATLPNKERFDLLHEFTFGDQQDNNRPKYYKEVVGTKLDETKIELQRLTTLYNVERSHIEQTQESHTAELQAWGDRSIEELPILQEKLDRDKDMLIEIRNKAQLALAAETKYQTQKAAITKLQSQIQTLKDTALPLDEISKLEEEHQRLIAALAQHKGQQDLIKTVDKLRLKLASLQCCDEDLKRSATDLSTIKVNLDLDKQRHAAFTELRVTPATYIKEIARQKEAIDKHQKQVAEHKVWQESIAQAEAKLQMLLKDHEEVKKRLMAEWTLKNKEVQQIHERNEAKKAEYAAKLKEYEYLRSQEARFVSEMKKYNLQLQKYEALNAEVKVLQQKVNDDEKWFNETFDDTPDPAETLSDCKSLLAEEVCPHCGAGVVRQGGKLVKGDSTAETRKATSEQMPRLIQMIKNQNELQQRKQVLVNFQLPTKPEPPSENVPSKPTPPSITELPEVPKLSYPKTPTIQDVGALPEPIVDLTSKQLTSISTKLQRLQLLTPPSLTLEAIDKRFIEIQNVDVYRSIADQIAALQSQITSTQLTPEMMNRCSELEKILTQQRSINSQLQVLVDNLKAAEQALPSVPKISSIDYSNDLKRLEREIEDQAALVAAGKRYQEIVALTEKLQSTDEHRVQYVNYQQSLMRIRDLIIEVSTTAMETIVSSINITVNEILQHLFRREIKVILSTTKYVESKDANKLEVNFEVYYRNNTFKKIDELSDGEQDRISFALMLALSIRTSSPLLLLDECMASIDGYHRERCLKALRVYARNKIVIHVCHEVVEGSHDHIVTVDKEELETQDLDNIT